MLKEDKIINDYLTPVLGDLMKKSLDSILNMKEQNLLTKDSKEDILFIAKFIDEAEQYYSSIKDTHNLAIINDLKQYLEELAG
jgi:hypothetical protein